MTTINILISQIKMPFHLQFGVKLYIDKAYLKEYYMLSKLRNIWPGNAEDSQNRPDLGRRGVLSTLAAGAAAIALTAIPGGNEAEAQDRKTAGLSAGERGLDGVQGMHDMRVYSEDAQTQGIGVFINLRENSSVTGDQIGQWIQRQFAGVTPPVPVQYRVNQSHGTATDVVFYVRGLGHTLPAPELQKKLVEIYSHHKDVWLPDANPRTSSLDTGAPSVSQN